MSEALPILPHYTYNEWVNWKGRWELIEGIPHAMSPMPVPKHQKLANALGGEFYFALKQCAKCEAYQAIDYKISDDTILQPDLLVICSAVMEKFLDFPPSLVVEISSPSTMLKDRHSKFNLYQSQRINYYIILSPDKEEVEIFVMKKDRYVLDQSGRDITYTFSFDADCTAIINFHEIW